MSTHNVYFRQEIRKIEIRMGGLSRANPGLRGSALHTEESESRSSLSLFCHYSQVRQQVK